METSSLELTTPPSADPPAVCRLSGEEVIRPETGDQGLEQPAESDQEGVFSPKLRLE